MAQPKIHWIGAGNTMGWASTACGIEATDTKQHGRYNTSNGGTIAAIYRSWDGVNCASCLRNAHSPKGRFVLSAVPSQDRS